MLHRSVRVCALAALPAVIVLCLLFAAGCANKKVEESKVDPADIKYTLLAKDLKTGMSYQEVVQIMGQDGQPFSPKPASDEGNVAPAAPGIKMYEWKNKDGSSVRCVFRNEKLVGPEIIPAPAKK